MHYNININEQILYRKSNDIKTKSLPMQINNDEIFINYKNNIINKNN